MPLRVRRPGRPRVDGWWGWHGGARVFTHTEVFPAFEGRGVGTALARGALDDVRASGRTLVARCPFIRSYIERQPEYADLVDADLEARLTSG